VKVEHGFVIVKPNGQRWGTLFYPGKESAEFIASCCGEDLRVLPARRVFSLRKASTTTARPCIDIIVDRSGQ
jgi:hypothetical protein